MVLKCLMNGYEKHRMLHDSIDYDKLWNAEDAMHTARRQYDRLRGWFWSCNQNCQVAKMGMSRRSAIGSFLTTTEFR